MQRELLTIKETARLLRVSEATVRRMIESGTIEAFIIRKQWRIYRDSVEKLMKGKP